MLPGLAFSSEVFVGRGRWDLPCQVDDAPGIFHYKRKILLKPKGTLASMCWGSVRGAALAC